MLEQIETRLITLKSEYDKGQLQLQQLQGQLMSLRDSMLRIGGAITILEEILSSTTAVKRDCHDLESEGLDNHASAFAE